VVGALRGDDIGVEGGAVEVDHAAADQVRWSVDSNVAGFYTHTHIYIYLFIYLFIRIYTVRSKSSQINGYFFLFIYSK
jgi:hypothetical protein